MEYLILGGNQGDMLNIMSINCSGKVITNSKGKKTRVVSLLLPIDYEIKESDKINKNDIYGTSSEANKKVTTKSIKTTSDEKTT
ncbi:MULTISPECIES: hypothetical protein [unclassified Myroides]|uniref:hypothetical protein n=1 Tax=unclassified Myroides TaxID=2642485 RepID=UPI003D2F6D4F